MVYVNVITEAVVITIAIIFLIFIMTAVFILLDMVVRPVTNNTPATSNYQRRLVEIDRFLCDRSEQSR